MNNELEITLQLLKHIKNLEKIVKQDGDLKKIIKVNKIVREKVIRGKEENEENF